MTDPSGIRIVGRGRGRFDTDYLIVSALDGGRRRKIAVPRHEINSSTVHADLGVFTTSNRNALCRAAEEAFRKLKPTVAVADQCGLCPGGFVWPTGEVSGDADILVALPSIAGASGWQALCGDLRGWQKIPRLASGNALFMVVLAHALTGPVVDFLGCESTMINLVGDAGVLKSALLDLGASAWAVGRRSWHGTANGIEQIASRHNGCYLAIDDLRPASDNGRVLTSAFVAMRDGIVHLADGHLKERMGQASLTWRVPVLSTSNASLDEMAVEAGLPLDAKQAAARGRLLDFPLPGVRRDRLFDELHGRCDDRHLILELAEVHRHHAGVAANAFVDGFLKMLAVDPEALRSAIIARRDAYVTWAQQRFGDRAGYRLLRLHTKMGTIYAGGCISIDLGILPWTHRDLRLALATCQAAHLALYDEMIAGDRSPIARHEPSPMDALRQHVRSTRGSLIDLRRGKIRDHRHDHDGCSGYLNQGKDGTLEVLFSEAMLQRVCGTAGRVAALKCHLDQHDFLLRGDRRPSVRRTIYASGRREDRVQVIAVRAAAFGERRQSR